jgi:hypothetical protein
VARTHHRWTFFVAGRQGYHDQETDLAHIQVSATEDFAVVLYDDTVPYVYSANGSGFAETLDLNWYGYEHDFDYPIVYYARCRNENTGGSIVSEWSNVFEIDGGNDGANHVNRTNMQTFSGATLVKETHWLGNEIFYNVSSEAIYKSGHTYVLVGQQRWLYETDSVNRDHTYGSLYLADYDGSAVTLTQIGIEVEDWGTSGSPVHYDVVEFGGKVYAGWYAPANAATSLYDWCEITGGVVGTIHHVAIPTEATGSTNWATMAIIYGSLRVIASLDTGTEYVMGIADILSDVPTMKVYPNIKTGYDFTKDPWLGSIWFDYENYDASETAICWLGSGAQTNAIWFVNSI